MSTIEIASCKLQIANIMSKKASFPLVLHSFFRNFAEK